MELQKIADGLDGLSPQELKQKYIDLYIAFESEKTQKNLYYEKYQLALLKRYGKSSEKNILGQLSLSDVLPVFNEAESTRDPINHEADLSKHDDEAETKSKSKKNSKKKNTKNLPVVDGGTYTLSLEDQVCPKCGEPLHEMKQEVRYEIEVIPSKTQIKKYTSVTYACRNCEKNNEATIITAPGAPKPVIDKSMASPSLLADVITKKYVDALPFYRQEQNYKRAGIPITRNNMCNWSIKVANDYFTPIVKMMKDQLFDFGVIHCDETYTEVLKEPDRNPTCKSYIWVMCSGEYLKDKRIAIYNYHEGRSAAAAREVLLGYEGYIMCDGYKSYDALLKPGKNGEPPMKVTLVACLVHVRRKFAEALRMIKASQRKDTSAWIAMKKIGNIFHIDNELGDLEPEDRRMKRLEQLKPALDDFFAWAKKEEALALPESHYGKAINYALSQEEKIYHVLDDGRLELENNLAERCVKPFVIGRKNWLFNINPTGANASCVLYSIIETAKANNLNPYEYIKYVLETLSQLEIMTDQDIEDVLPWSSEIPDYVKNPEVEEI